MRKCNYFVEFLIQILMSSSEASSFKYFLSGGFGGICTIFAGHPFDTIKVRLQAMPKHSVGGPMYTGAWDCAVKTLKNEGFRGFYKGMTVPIMGVAPVFAIKFFSFKVAKRLQQSVEVKQLTNREIFYAGALSGLLPTVLVAPGERVKCLLQTQHGTVDRKYSGPWDVLHQLYREGGIRSVYRGTEATFLREVPPSGVYFLTYEWIQKVLKPEGASSFGTFRTILAGGSAGVTMWLVALPADVLKSRLQTAPEGTYPRGVRDVFSKLVKEEGVNALYKGWVPVMMRAFPANAACFVGFEFAKHFLDWLVPSW